MTDRGCSGVGPPDPGLLVLGLGNPIRRDDAVGLEVAARARDRLGPDYAAKVTWKALSVGGFDLLYEVLGFRRLIVVDALFDPPGHPGRVRVLSLGEVEVRAGAIPHLLSLPQALAWGRAAGYRVPVLHAVVVVEVGRSCMEFGEGLTDPVRAAVPGAVDLLCRVVRDVARSPAGESRLEELRQ